MFDRHRAVVAAIAMTCLFAAACGADEPSTDAKPSASVSVRDDLQSVFEAAGMRGSFALLDVASGQLTVVDRERAERPDVPASTFKIAHSLIALETGVVEDENEVIPYGGQPQPVPSWEQDMSIREAVPASNAAVFQQIARRVGPERMRTWLDRLDYGNREIGPNIDRFWLDGPLKISPVEQTRFLAELAQRQLDVSVATQQTVTDIIALERTPDYALYGKTGWRFDAEPQLGWWVGWVQRGERLFTFALNMDMKGAADAKQREPIGRELLKRLNVLPNA